MPVDGGLVDEAMATLGVTPVRALRDGGQKTVRLVSLDGDELVMKVVALDSASPDALRRAQREVDLLKSVSHPNVVKVASDLVELGEPVRGAAWLEVYLEGEDLSELLGVPWEVEEALRMARDVASGLGALHAAKVVHRDLSAGNVRRTPTGYVVMDPGFARHTLRSGITAPGGQPGTLGFMSPEHLQSYSGAPNAASDVFAVGILLFAALTGFLPIPVNGDPADYLSRLLSVETLDISSLRADLPPDVVALVGRCLHAQSARRPRNGARLVDELEQLP